MASKVALFVLFVALVAVSPASSSDSGYIYSNDVVTQFQNDLIKHVMPYFTPTSNLSIASLCWKGTSVRGVGTPIDSCRPGEEMNGFICYPLCATGYYGAGPLCFSYCKPGFEDIGALCSRAGSIISADTSGCPWYDVCGLVTARGCSHCPDGYNNDGCTCRIDPQVYAKDSYGRGVGLPLTCPSDKEMDAGLCYWPCSGASHGVGPVCWGYCPSSMPNDAGALCCADAQDCSNSIADMAKGVMSAILSGIEAGEDPAVIMDAIKSAIEALLGFVLPICA